MALGKISERSCFAIYVDANFSADYTETDYKVIGTDLDDLSVALNPEVERKKNILGESSVTHSGYEPSIDVSTFYHRAKEVLEAKIMELAMYRKQGDSCKTSMVEVLMEKANDGVSAPNVIYAFREDVLCVPESYGGDTTGVQVPFSINPAGNRVKGNFDLTTKKFTENDL